MSTPAPSPPPSGSSATKKAILFTGAAIELVDGSIAEWLPDHYGVIISAIGTAVIGIGALYHVYFDHTSS